MSCAISMHCCVILNVCNLYDCSSVKIRRRWWHQDDVIYQVLKIWDHSNDGHKVRSHVRGLGYLFVYFFWQFRGQNLHQCCKGQLPHWILLDRASGKISICWEGEVVNSLDQLWNVFLKVKDNHIFKSNKCLLCLMPNDWASLSAKFYKRPKFRPCLWLECYLVVRRGHHLLELL